MTTDKNNIGPAPSILVVDDNEVFRDRLARAFRDRGYETRTAADCEQALASANEDSPELAVVDLRMPGRSGLELLRDLKQIDPSTKVIMLTGYGSIATAIEAIRLGATYYVPKPADADDIIAAFERGQAPPLRPSEIKYSAPSLARAEWEHINRVLADCGGNVSEAARRLGVHRRSLQRKLQKYPPPIGSSRSARGSSAPTVLAGGRRCWGWNALLRFADRSRDPASENRRASRCIICSRPQKCVHRELHVGNPAALTRSALVVDPAAEPNPAASIEHDRGRRCANPQHGRQATRRIYDNWQAESTLSRHRTQALWIVVRVARNSK